MTATRIAFLFGAAIASAAAMLAGPAAAQHNGQSGDMWQPYWMQRDIWDSRNMNPGVRQRMERHWTFMHRSIPAEYENAHNPLSPSPETVDAGRTLYTEHCASCHGATGTGDGEEGRALSPSPALLAYLVQMPMSVDSYLLWTISDGGKEFGTAMPAFGDTLKKNDIWQIVTFLRAGLPPGRTDR